MPKPKGISVKQKKRGRPVTTGTSPLINVRLSENILTALERWMAKQKPAPASRSEAIRELLIEALESKGVTVKP
jgi:uroporphyrinogen-III synthase